MKWPRGRAASSSRQFQALGSRFSVNRIPLLQVLLLAALVLSALRPGVGLITLSPVFATLFDRLLTAVIAAFSVLISWCIGHELLLPIPIFGSSKLLTEDCSAPLLEYLHRTVELKPSSFVALLLVKTRSWLKESHLSSRFRWPEVRTIQFKSRGGSAVANA